MRRNPPPNKTQFEYEYIRGRLLIAKMEMEKSEIMKRISELYDDLKIDINKEFFLATVDHQANDDDIKQSRELLGRYQRDIDQWNANLNMMVEELRKYNSKKRSLRYTANQNFTKNKRPKPLEAKSKEEVPVVLISSDSSESESGKEMTLLQNPINQWTTLKADIARSNTSNLTEEKVPEVINSSRVDYDRELIKTILHSSFSFDLKVKRRSKTVERKVMSEVYEQYLIDLFKKFSPDEHREIMEMSVIAHSDEDFHQIAPKRREQKQIQKEIEENQDIKPEPKPTTSGDLLPPKQLTRRQRKNMKNRKRAQKKTNRMNNSIQRERHSRSSNKNLECFGNLIERNQELNEFIAMSDEFYGS